MKKSELYGKINTAVAHATPDVFDAVLAECEKAALPALLPAAAPSKKSTLSFRVLSAAAAAVVLITGGLFGANLAAAQRVESVVTLDVNPSIQMDVNRSEKVLSAHAVNQDGQQILDGMDLRGASLEVAVNALIGSMVKQGYLDEFKNSVLLTVQDKDDARSAQLKQRLSDSISGLLQASHLDGAVLSQSTTGDTALQEMARTYGISEGKAALIQEIMQGNTLAKAEELAVLSVNDLNLLLTSKKTPTPDIASTGSASDKSYIGKEQAKTLALEQAGVQEADVTGVEIEMDCDDGIMVYEVEFIAHGIEYDFEINATDGSLNGNTPADADGTQPSSADSYIGTARAREIVLEHAELPADSAIVMEIELENNMYEISFDRGGREYEYWVNAVTGEIVRWESEREN